MWGRLRHLTLLGCLLSGCAADSQSGLPALLRVVGAQFVPGEPVASPDGPAVVGLSVLQNSAYAGELGKPVAGTLAEGATAAALFLEGDLGHWIVVAGPPDVTAPRLPTFAASLDFSPSLPAGDRRLRVQAGDAQDRLGPAASQTLAILPRDQPAGQLVVSLAWEREADLDLHVEDPTGVVIWSRQKSGYTAPPPGTPPDPEALKRAGRLDFDSNAACVIDGRRRENIHWTAAPPSGRYRVRVDTFSLCREAVAYWTVEVRAAGQLVGHASGQSGPESTRGTHGPDAGVLAFEFGLP